MGDGRKSPGIAPRAVATRYKSHQQRRPQRHLSSMLLNVIRALLLAVIVAAFVRGQEPALLQHFEYDSKAPLDIQESNVEQRGDVSVHDITYASPRGGRVPAYLVVPKGKGPF